MELNDLEKIDARGMFKTYDRWPEIASEAFEKKFEKIQYDNIDHIVFAGMGGSGSIGDTIAAILSKENIHISNVKGFSLPKTVDSKTLVVVTSVSGITKESLEILQNAKKTYIECKNKKVLYLYNNSIDLFILWLNIDYIGIFLDNKYNFHH